MILLRGFPVLLLVFTILFVGCNLFSEEQPDPLFKQLDSTKTGVDFVNEVTYDIDFNVISFPYIYNGGGVAAGDINNDGLTDLYFTGNMVSSRLYLNEGDMQFRDITESSHTGTAGWAHGVSMVDINGDGYLDIYVSVSGPEGSNAEERKNKLFINNQDQTFTEQAEKFGIADTGYTTHTAFFDYDLDGDLDAYLINNYPGSFSRDSRIRMRDEVNDGTARSTDTFYENNGDGTFTDVSATAGILKEGYSLGITINDYNRDGWPDIYVSNDIQSDDLLYINNRDGTFTDRAPSYFKHTSYAGMGTDAADFNNDGWPDIIQVDMMPPSLQEQQMVTGASDYDYHQELLQRGYEPQYPLNTLQLANGTDQNGNVVYSEIAKLAGVAYTDWSWSALMGDYDSDGYKDLMITNGYPKNVNSYDYIIDLNRSVMFGGESAHQKTKYDKLNQLDSIKVKNYFFKNQGDLTFLDQSQEWGFNSRSFSYGAAYADLDNDLDLDVVINNTNDHPFLYENQADTLKADHHNLLVRLKGDSLNSYGIGAKVMVTAGGEKQFSYMSPYRGYESSMEPKVHFGLGAQATVDSLEVIWPDGSYQLLTNVEADKQVILDYAEADGTFNRSAFDPSRHFFRAAGLNKLNISYKHQENTYNDFEKEPLLPHLLSRLGPGIAVGDVNNDDIEDFYIGGASGSAGTLYLQQENGTFTKSTENQPWETDQKFEDIGATMFDANGDGNLDLYVVSGGNEFSPASEMIQDRLYLNTGEGNFIRTEDALPNLLTSGSVVKPADYDGDGDLDLFVGGRLVPGQYPQPADSYILRNDGGTFTDVTKQVAPGLTEMGLVTDAEWIDYDDNGTPDLVTTGIWMPVTFLKNTGGTFQEATSSVDSGEHVGWWYSLEKGDFDGDGDQDLIAGNLGLNSNYKSSKTDPLEVYARDFDGNRSLDAILAVKKEDGSYPIKGMRALGEQMPRLMRKFQSFESYGNASLSEMVGEEKLDQAMHYMVDTFASSYIENEGDGTFHFNELPNRAQFSTINDMIPMDVNGDGHLDCIIAGNLYNTAPQTARNDASNGLVLLGNGRGSFRAVSPFESGFMAPGNVKDLATITIAGTKAILVANNDDSLKVIRSR